MKTHISPNFNDRTEGTPLDWVILHYTDVPTVEEALALLTSPQSQVSAHYLVDEDGEVYALVDEAYRAWHAGVGYWRGKTDLNSHTIGIEIQNPGHSHGYRAFPEAQLKSVLNLCKDIQRRHALGCDCVWGHSDIAPARKQDPGHLFPWERFAKEGLGIWPGEALSFETDPLQLLRAIGYDPAYPPESVIAFQRHFRPTRIDGQLDLETIALLRKVAYACGV